MHKHWTQVCFDFFKREHVLEIFVIDKFSPWKIITSIFLQQLTSYLKNSNPIPHSKPLHLIFLFSSYVAKHLANTPIDEGWGGH